jgi:transposase
MQVMVERGCGLDIGEDIVVACLLVGRAGRRSQKTIRTFRAYTRDLQELRDWLLAEGCTHVAMESTGIYWVPIYSVLEDHFELVVGNAARIKGVPGRKTDVKDAEWIADLLRHGLITKSFVPPHSIRQLRELVRYRRKVVENRSSERNRVLRLLESANIKLANVASDVFGKSGLLMLRALLDGTHSLDAVAQLAKGKLRRKLPQLVLALDGRLQDHHRLLLDLQLHRLEHLDSHLDRLERHIAERAAPFRTEIDLLKQIPGVDEVVAITIIAEIGNDMTVFRGARELAAWAGVCPGNHESAGKRRNVRVRKGNPHLKPVLVQAATAAARTKGTYLRAKFLRLNARRGYKRAIMAIAHKILLSAYRVLAGVCPYRDLGENYLDQVASKRITRNLVRRLEALGYNVELKPTAA